MSEATLKSDFYVLPGSEPAAREIFLYKLLERVYALGHQIYIHTDSEAAAKALDSRLWEYRPDAFLPHSLSTEENPGPIQIGYDDHLPQHRDVHINMAYEIDAPALQFQRTIEIVVQDEDILNATRANYRYYKTSGYQIKTNDMRQNS